MSQMGLKFRERQRLSTGATPITSTSLTHSPLPLLSLMIRCERASASYALSLYMEAMHSSCIAAQCRASQCFATRLTKDTT